MIILCMIVKDEAHVIRRCLESVKPFVDGWMVSDTGSTDGTQDIVREIMGDLPGVLVEDPWADFAHNRNEALDHARIRFPGAHYALTIDADETLLHVREWLEPYDQDGYMLPVEYAGTRYDRLALVRMDRPWWWRGVVHEYLHLDGADIGRLTAPTIHVEHDGARAHDPDTYRKDAALLEKALRTETDEGLRARYEFYLAQSYKDAGQPTRAIEAYRRRAENPVGYAAERWYSLYQLGLLNHAADPAEATIWYLGAYELDPTRAEPLVDLARLMRENERFRTATMFAERATLIPQPETGLFVETAAYTFRRWDEYAVSAFYAGDRDGAYRAARIALSYNPDDPRLRENVRLIQEAL